MKTAKLNLVDLVYFIVKDYRLEVKESQKQEHLVKL